MNIFLTFDYELFFGASTGTVKKCLIDPTNRLLTLAQKNEISLTFFVDVGYLLRLEDYKTNFPELETDYQQINEQLIELVKQGHDLQLHIHPHWEKSTYANGKWTMITKDAYRLADFDDDSVGSIFRRYKAKLDSYRSTPCHTFRAGGWCIQPFDKLKPYFEELGIRFDSSVFPGGFFASGNYQFDFRSAPNKAMYAFNDDVCKEVSDGKFIEYPIASWRYSPIFYWKLYILGRLFPHQHKMLGDGVFMDQPGRKRSVLSNWTWNHVSTDGYYASLLSKITRTFSDQKQSDMVVIGHPKSMTNFSFQHLNEFVAAQNTKHRFLTFSDIS